jgi:rhomboid protease GluP
LRIATAAKAEEEIKQAAELDKVMNLSSGNMYFTYAIIAINIVVFIAMGLNGAGWLLPEGTVHVLWGSNFTPLTLSGDWWRLLTNVFIHFGIIHLAMNMYCLYTVGIYLEPMLGKLKYITAYCSTGVLASLVSLWWHQEGVNSAGASGAIFGLYGLFLALLTSKLIPQQVRQSLLQSIGIFVAYNLLYGMKSGVDNAAHIGGLISGFIVGIFYLIEIKKQQSSAGLKWVAPLFFVITIAVSFLYLDNHRVSAATRKTELEAIRAAGYKDQDTYAAKMNAFFEIEQMALDTISSKTMDQALFVDRVKLAIPLWEKPSS